MSQIVKRHMSPNPSLLLMAVNRHLLQHENCASKQCRNDEKVQLGGAHKRIRDNVEYSGKRK